MYADGSRARVFVPVSLLRTAFKGGCGTDPPETGWSTHSAFIPGGLERARFAVQGRALVPEFGASLR